MQNMLTPSDVAKRLSINLTTAYRVMDAAGCYDIGTAQKTRRIPEDKLNAW